MPDVFVNFWQELIGVINTIKLNDFLDIAIVAFIIYNIIKLFRDTRAEQLVKGIALLGIVFGFASIFQLRTLTFIMENVFRLGAIALFVVFQPELRRALEQVGRTKIGKISLFSSVSDIEERNNQLTYAINEICDAAVILQRQKMGALIVFERTTKLGEIISTGSIVDAQPTAELICNIFYNKAPMHDGAIIIRNGRIYACACILPLSQNKQISKELGTRHRAALGMSENSDAVVLIISEETGALSLAVKGTLKRNLSLENIKAALIDELLEIKKDSSDEKTSFWKGIFK